MNQSSKQDLRQILGKFLTGVTVVTTLDRHAIPVGFTANSFTSVSLDPPLVLVCLARSAGLAPVFRRAQSFAINILSTEQEAISNAFARKEADRFASVDWEAKATGSPIISGCAAWLDCKMYEKIIAGDHVILIGRIVGAEKTMHHPLGYYQGRYCAIDLPEETLSLIEHRESVHSTTGIIVDFADQILLFKHKNGRYDVPRVKPGNDGDASRIDAAMTRLGIEVHNKTLFSVVEGRHHQRISIYYRCSVEPGAPLPEGARYFTAETIPFDKLARADLGSVLRRYLDEKYAGQFGIYVGDEHQGHIEHIAEKKI